MHTGIYSATIGIHLGNRSRILSNKFCKNSWRWLLNSYYLWRYHRNSYKKGIRCRMDTKSVLFLVKCLTWIPLHSASNYLEILDSQYHIVEVYVTQYISRHAYYCLNWWLWVNIISKLKTVGNDIYLYIYIAYFPIYHQNRLDSSRQLILQILKI